MDLNTLSQQLIAGHADEVALLTKRALEEEVSPARILQHGLIAGMQVVGEQFRENVIFVPEVLMAARAMKAGMVLLEPALAAQGVSPMATFVIGSVKGDIHDIGKNLVAIMLRGAGFNVIDLGVDVPLRKFIAAIEQYQPEIVGMSALLTTTMAQMKINVEGFRQAGLLDRMRVMVGGAPVSRDFANACGAHGYAKDVSTAVQVARRLVDELKAQPRDGNTPALDRL